MTKLLRPQTVPFLVTYPRSGMRYVCSTHMSHDKEVVGVEWGGHGAGRASFRYLLVVMAVLQLLLSFEKTGRESAERDLWDVTR